MQDSGTKQNENESVFSSLADNVILLAFAAER